MTIRLPAGIHENLRRVAFERRASMNALIADAVAEWLRIYAERITDAEQMKRIQDALDAFNRSTDEHA